MEDGSAFWALLFLAMAAATSLGSLLQVKNEYTH